MPKIVLHVDMNSYFASVEQQANPFLRGKPVGVCAYLSKNGCIIAASIEAKKIGIKTGTLVYEARKICPSIILVENNPDKYRSTSEKIFSIFQDYSDRVEVYSIDEAFIDLDGFRYDFKKAEKLAIEIKQRIKEEVGEWLKCSIGISQTRFLAKLAGELKKPDGLTILSASASSSTKASDDKKATADKPEEILFLDEVLKNLKLTDICGINHRLEARLNFLGIYTPLELKKYPVGNLMSKLGKYGYYLWSQLHGIEIEKVRTQAETLPKSIGHSYCLPKKTKDLVFLRKVLMKLCEKTGRRLRAENLEASGVMAAIGYLRSGGMHMSRKLPETIFASQQIFYHADKILFSRPLLAPVSFLAVSVSSLKSASNQASFFSQKKEKLKSQSAALDKINNKYGEYTMVPGLMWECNDYAKDRIGFRKSVSLKEKE